MQRFVKLRILLTSAPVALSGYRLILTANNFN